MSLAQGQMLQIYGFPIALWPARGSRGIVVKYTTALFFLSEKSLYYQILIIMTRRDSDL